MALTTNETTAITPKKVINMVVEIIVELMMTILRSIKIKRAISK